LLRREINFLNDIKDGSRKIGEMHINRANYRNYNTEKVNLLQRLFAKFWSSNLLRHLKKLDKLVVLTDRDRESWVELNNVVTIPDPLSLSPTTISLLTEKRVVTIARYSHEKGIDLLLKAWSIVEKQVSDWCLDIFGDGDRTSYEQLIDELKINSSRCQLHGRTNDVEKEYLNSSLFVLTSRFEGFGMVITEAMVCGLPVISFDCPWGPRSIIKDGEDGFLVGYLNTTEAAEKVVQLIESPELRICVGSVSL
jgi:glycosyltransferase involved in cell wall biosynthesis